MHGLSEVPKTCNCREPAQVVSRTAQDLFLETHGVKLGFMSAFVKASADALLKVPAVNGVIDGDEIIYRDYTDISIAVATPKGLVVPVLRNVDSLSFAEVEKVRACGYFWPDNRELCPRLDFNPLHCQLCTRSLYDVGLSALCTCR